jgi:isoquinoline 1-oxidoreductase alpha subunit
VGGSATRSCVTPVAAAAGRSITTVEGLGGDALHALQQAWLDEQVPQCGYCQPGQLMQAATLLARNPNPTDEEIDRYLVGNLCRCGAYLRIRRAIRRAAGEVNDAR